MPKRSMMRRALPPERTEAVMKARNAFDIGMRELVMEYDATDLDRNRKLDFKEFSQMVRSREMAIHSEAALRQRFEALE